jgi:hypothetical protein
MHSTASPCRGTGRVVTTPPQRSSRHISTRKVISPDQEEGRFIVRRRSRRANGMVLGRMVFLHRMTTRTTTTFSRHETTNLQSFFSPDNAPERARKTLLFDTYILRRQFYCTAAVAMYVLFHARWGRRKGSIMSYSSICCFGAMLEPTTPSKDFGAYQTTRGIRSQIVFGSICFSSFVDVLPMVCAPAATAAAAAAPIIAG